MPKNTKWILLGGLLLAGLLAVLGHALVPTPAAPVHDPEPARSEAVRDLLDVYRIPPAQRQWSEGERIVSRLEEARQRYEDDRRTTMQVYKCLVYDAFGREEEGRRLLDGNWLARAFYAERFGRADEPLRAEKLEYLETINRRRAQGLPPSPPGQEDRRFLVDDLTLGIGALGEDPVTQRSRECTDLLVAEAGLAPGETWAEIGFGGGWWLWGMAQRLGPTGEVIGVELDQDAVAFVNAANSLAPPDAGLAPVRALVGTVEDCRLGEGTVDGIAMHFTFHSLGDFPLEGPPTGANTANLEGTLVPYLRTLHRALRPGGRMVIVDNGPAREWVLWTCEKAGFRLARDRDLPMPDEGPAISVPQDLETGLRERLYVFEKPR